MNKNESCKLLLSSLQGSFLYRYYNRRYIYLFIILVNFFLYAMPQVLRTKISFKTSLLHKPKFLSYYTLRYHRCYAPRYRLDVVCFLPLAAASYHTRPWHYIIQQFNKQHIFQGFVEGDVWAPCVATLLCGLTPYPSHAVL